MVEIKAGESWLGKAESPLAVTVDFVGDRYVVAHSDIAGEFTMLKVNFTEVYAKVEPFFEVGKTYRKTFGTGLHEIKILAVDEYKGHRWALGWEHRRGWLKDSWFQKYDDCDSIGGGFEGWEEI